VFFPTTYYNIQQMFEKRKEYINSMAMIIAQIIILSSFTRYFIIEPGRVDGPSMEPTFIDNEFFLINKAAYFFKSPERFDVVQVLVEGKYGRISVIKRIIGLPSERIVVEGGKIWIETADGKKTALDEPYLHYGTLTKVRFGAESRFTIPVNHYFIIGDNRGQSTDSRDIGSVHRKQINGQVVQLN